MNSPNTVVRPAVSSDVEIIVAMIRALAGYEGLSEECAVQAEPLREHLFGPKPLIEVLIAEIDGTAAGFALFFPTYSTFLTKPGLWLEDLFVTPEHRRRGVGVALLTRVAQLAADRGCGRLEWSVLGWNRSAIDFYRRLGARLMHEWTICRVDAKDLAAFADITQDQPLG